MGREGRRGAAGLAAALAGGVYVTAIFATTGRPDAVAVAIAGLALAGVARKGGKAEVGIATGAMLAAAAWSKPNVLGIAAGVFVVAAARRDWKGVVRAAVGGIAVTAPVALVLGIASHGVWLQHVTRSLGQPLALDVWWGHVWTRAMFVAPAAWVTWAGWRGRGDRGVMVALAAWVGSLGWAVVSLGKIGSASNYWMEPAMAAVVVVGSAPSPRLTGLRAAGLGIAAAGASAWIAAATVGGVVEAFEREPRRAALLARARADCGARPGDVVVADNPGSELALDGRVVAPGLETLFLVVQGHLPLSTWIADLRRPEVACVLEQDGLFHALPEIERVVGERFVEVEVVEDWHLFARRDAPR